MEKHELEKVMMDASGAGIRRMAPEEYQDFCDCDRSCVNMLLVTSTEDMNQNLLGRDPSTW